MDALGNPSHTVVTIDRAGHRAGEGGGRLEVGEGKKGNRYQGILQEGSAAAKLVGICSSLKGKCTSSASIALRTSLPDARNLWKCIFFSFMFPNSKQHYQTQSYKYDSLAFSDHLYWFNLQRVFPSTIWDSHRLLRGRYGNSCNEETDEETEVQRGRGFLFMVTYWVNLHGLFQLLLGGAICTTTTHIRLGLLKDHITYYMYEGILYIYTLTHLDIHIYISM